MRQLQRGLEEELAEYQEPGNGGYLCWQNFQPILELRRNEVNACFLWLYGILAWFKSVLTQEY